MDRNTPSIVAPGVGAWVEISHIITISGKAGVAPGVGAWVEIEKSFFGAGSIRGRPRCGGVG